MSYLAIEQLENEVSIEQKFKVTRSMNLEAVRLNMCKVGNLLNGTITVQILNNEILLGQMVSSCSELNTVGTNFHGMISFFSDSPIAIRKSPSKELLELTLRVTLSEHTDSDEAYLGLIRNPDPATPTYNPENNPNPSDPAIDVWYLPFGLELYTN
jgi:hypothetical protein